MSTVLQLEEVRQLVIRNFKKFGASLNSLSDLSETIMIRQGRCEGRCYRAAELVAVWLMKPDLIEFYRDDGTPLTTLRLTQPWVASIAA